MQKRLFYNQTSSLDSSRDIINFEVLIATPKKTSAEIAINSPTVVLEISSSPKEIERRMSEKLFTMLEKQNTKITKKIQRENDR